MTKAEKKAYELFPDYTERDPSMLMDADEMNIFQKAHRAEYIKFYRDVAGEVIESVIAWLKEHKDNDGYTWYDETENESGITDKCIEDLKNYIENEIE